MALTDTGLKNLKPKGKGFSKSDSGGLMIEVAPSGSKSWRLRFRMGGRGSKQEKISLGEYPTYKLAEARQWRDDCRALVQRGLSPVALKRGDPSPADARPELKEMAQAFLTTWCWQTLQRAKVQEAGDTVEAFARGWLTKIVEPANTNPSTIKRVLEKDVFPAIGSKQIAAVTVADVLGVVDKIKARGAAQMALQTRNMLKRLFEYAIAREKTTFNPAAAVDAKFITTPKSRDVALSPEELGRLLRSIYTSDMRRAHKLGLHLLILTMVRKSELIEARWEEIDFKKAEWSIPGARMKMDKPHIVPLPRQAIAMFQELQALASGSEWIFPSSWNLDKPIAKSTLNAAVRTLEHDVQDFVIHDFRRTASTLLHESGHFNSDVIEKALAHETGGIRGVYNRAEYLEQRCEMLAWWADFVDAQIEKGRKVVI